jgi:sugar phosphate isomerase/epimerase
MVKIASSTGAYMMGPYAENPIPINTIAEKLEELRFDGIELSGGQPHAHPMDYPTKKDREDLAAMFRGYHLEIAGYGADLSRFPMASNYPSIAAGYEKRFDVNLQFCVDCGIKVMRVDTVSSPPCMPGVDYETAWRRVVSMFKKCAKKAHDSNVLLVWEFEPWFMFTKPKSEVLRLVREVDHENFKVLFDTCHAQMCSVVAARQKPPLETLRGGVPEFARLLKGWIGHIHLIDSDNTLHDGLTSTHAPFGEGVLDFDEIMPALKEAGCTSGWWGLDLCFWPDSWDRTPDAKKFIDKLKAKYG